MQDVLWALGEEWLLPELGSVGSLSAGGRRAEKKWDVFPTVRRTDGAMMLMNGERESWHLSSAEMVNVAQHLHCVHPSWD